MTTTNKTATDTPIIHHGLDGVYVDTTAVSEVIPEKSQLAYRGYLVDALAEHCSFEEVAYLLWYGELPTTREKAAFIEEERALRYLPDYILKVLDEVPEMGHPMDILRTLVSAYALSEDTTKPFEEKRFWSDAIKLYAKIPLMVAASFRKRRGQEYIPPRSDLSFSENFFYMCFGEVPLEKVVKAFDVSMVLYAEHGFNASTFTSRVIASSLADIYGAVVGGIASLKGPLHGGANEAVMHMLKEIDTVENAEPWLRQALLEKRKVMGFGHRVYRNGDSRVPMMSKYRDLMAKTADGQKWVEISHVLEHIMISEKNIYPNLDFPAGPAYYLMGFDIDYFTPFFVMSRITGWSAHLFEQYTHNRLIRPLGLYEGLPFRNINAA